MKYQDLKVRDAGRLFGLGLLLATIAGGLFYCDGLGILSLTGRWHATMIGLALSALLSWGGAIWYLVTTPEQNARFLEKQKANGRTTLDVTLLIDPENPYYRVTTLAYIFRRSRP